MSNYTKGEWRVNPDSIAPFAIVSDKGTIGRSIVHPSISDKERSANLKLMTAAPELLEALHLVLKAHEGNGEITGIEVMKLVRSAIKKATL